MNFSGSSPQLLHVAANANKAPATPIKSAFAKRKSVLGDSVFTVDGDRSARSWRSVRLGGFRSFHGKRMSDPIPLSTNDQARLDRERRGTIFPGSDRRPKSAFTRATFRHSEATHRDGVHSIPTRLGILGGASGRRGRDGRRKSARTRRRGSTASAVGCRKSSALGRCAAESDRIFRRELRGRRNDDGSKNVSRRATRCSKGR